MTFRKNIISHIAGYMALLGTGWDRLLRKLNRGSIINYSDWELSVILAALQRVTIRRGLPVRKQAGLNLARGAA